jgi:hypothetical protein
LRSKQPARAVHQAAGTPIAAQAIGLIDRHPIDHLAPVLATTWKRVVDDLRLRSGARISCW